MGWFVLVLVNRMIECLAHPSLLRLLPKQTVFLEVSGASVKSAVVNRALIGLVGGSSIYAEVVLLMDAACSLDFDIGRRRMTVVGGKLGGVWLRRVGVIRVVSAVVPDAFRNSVDVRLEVSFVDGFKRSIALESPVIPSIFIRRRAWGKKFAVVAGGHGGRDS